jgi:hypothetical protein
LKPLLLANKDDVAAPSVKVTKNADGTVTTSPLLNDYFFLPGRPGGQIARGGTGPDDDLVFKPGGNNDSDIVMDFSDAVNALQSMKFLLPTNLTFAPNASTHGEGQTFTVGAGGGMRAQVVAGIYNLTSNAINGIPFLVYTFQPVVNIIGAATPADLKSPSIFRAAATFSLDAGAGDAFPVLGNLGTTPTPMAIFESKNIWTRRVGTETGTVTLYTVHNLADSITAGWTFGTYRVHHCNLTGAGTFTDFVYIDIEDLVARGFTFTNPPRSLRSLGTTMRMEHRGPVCIGALGAPNTVSGLDLAGDLSTRSVDVALANGVNNDIAIGNKSFVRITGPTAAFSISSVGTPTDGKRVVIVNTTAFAMTITNAAAVGTATNRILTTTLADLVGTATHPTTVELIYDAVSTRWRDVNFRP